MSLCQKFLSSESWRHSIQAFLNTVFVLAVSSILAPEVVWPAEAKRIEIKGVYTHPLSKMTFPEQLGEFNRGGVVQFDTGGANIGVGYSLLALNAEIFITAYVYPVQGVQDELASVLERQFAAEKSSIVRSYSSARLLSESNISIDQNGGTKGKRASFGIEQIFLNRQQATRSDLYLFVFSQWFLKFRITYPEKESGGVKQYLQDFLAEVRIPQSDLR
jgi:hypothetical protein